MILIILKHKLERYSLSILLLFISVFVLTTCEQIFENVAEDLIPEPKTLKMGLLNKTPYSWKRGEIRSGNTIQH
ncbi:hypothetical protein [Formosa sp. PL04]|uniref:hypothetical protein n=1 Tax=Formosa sp. PL04 TaxID=3081755 RepID=UPI0029825FF2|nr:hypothetical protein [Formosa sp. PL04]MDW5288953.1 hypothetical protein [Formosa sp. PL04]